MRYIVVLRGTNVIGAKDSAFILLRLRRNSEEFFNMLYDSTNARGFIQSKIKTNYLH